MYIIFDNHFFFGNEYLKRYILLFRKCILLLLRVWNNPQRKAKALDVPFI